MILRKRCATATKICENLRRSAGRSGTINSRLDDITIIATATPIEVNPVPVPLAAVGGLALLPLAAVGRRRMRQPD